jgi:hypothetical protein
MIISAIRNAFFANKELYNEPPNRTISVIMEI